MDLASIREHASETSLLRTLSAEHVDEVFSLATKRSYRKGEVIFNQGEPGESAILILSGVVKISMVAATGREIVFAYHSAGDIVGEISILDGSERAASAAAAQKTDCLVIHRTDLHRKLAERPELARGVIRFLCARIRATNALLESDRSYQTAARLARGILRLVKDHASPGDGEQLGFAISQSDLGAYVSLSRENVSRQIKDWVRAGILEMKDGKISIVDHEALEEIGDVYE